MLLLTLHFVYLVSCADTCAGVAVLTGVLAHLIQLMEFQVGKQIPEVMVMTPKGIGINIHPKGGS